MAANLTSTFSGRKYLSLESFRKNGQGVATPIWFAEHSGILYAYSEAGAGKVKRIRNNPRVRVAPCDARGRLEGEWVEAQARLVEGEEASRAERLLVEKYGFQKRLLNLFAKLGALFRPRPRAYIAISPAAEK